MSTEFVKIVLYAPFSQLAGRREVLLPFEPGMTVDRALRRLAGEVPGLAAQLSPEGIERTFLAVAGGRLLGTDSTLGGGEELLLVPPMAGG